MDNDFYENNHRKYNKVLTMICSFVPGGGHMYLGLMKKGLQFMFLFFGVITVTDLIYSARSLTIFNIMIWFYAFFDAYHTRKKLEAECSVEDDLLSELSLGKVRPKYIGVGFISLGLVLLIQQSLIEIFSIAMIKVPDYIKLAILESIFPVVLILIGVIILKKNRNKD